VHFDLWKGESDVQGLIALMTDDLRASGQAVMSEGALVINVARESDTKEMPPLISSEIGRRGAVFYHRSRHDS